MLVFSVVAMPNPNSDLLMENCTAKGLMHSFLVLSSPQCMANPS